MLLSCLIIFLLSYIWYMFGVTIGYHRLLSHRSFRCPKIVEYFWVLTGYMAFQASPIFWATTHRAHHRYTDEPRDPHSPRVDGWQHAYYGWIGQSTYPDYMAPENQSKDLINDPVYRFLEQGGDWHKGHVLSAIIGFGSRIVLAFFIGWPYALANLLAALTVQQIPLLLNVVCHVPKLGYKGYPTEDDSVNVWWVALLTMGEGWHNNHHAFPGSARHGFRRFELDPTWMMLRLMKLLHLVTWLHEDTFQSTYKAPVSARPISIPAKV
jgi:stearoyl-CoA desaturase (delta-9 desaturase)